jgi:hypothetical protein
LRERERERDHLLYEVHAEAERDLIVTQSVVPVRHQLRPKKELYVIDSVITLVSMKHQLRPKKQLFVTESVTSVVSMSHQLRLEKQLFATQECYVYEKPAEVKGTVVCNSRVSSL